MLILQIHTIDVIFGRASLPATLFDCLNYHNSQLFQVLQREYLRHRLYFEQREQNPVVWRRSGNNASRKSSIYSIGQAHIPPDSFEVDVVFPPDSFKVDPSSSVVLSGIHRSNYPVGCTTSCFRSGCVCVVSANDNVIVPLCVYFAEVYHHHHPIVFYIVVSPLPPRKKIVNDGSNCLRLLIPNPVALFLLLLLSLLHCRWNLIELRDRICQCYHRRRRRWCV